MDRTRQPFSFWVPLDVEKSVEISSPTDRMICGIISTEDRDLDGEVILEQFSTYSPMLQAMGKNLGAALADQIDFDRFSTRQGFLKFEHFSGECPTCHAGETANIIGVPERVEKGVQYRDPINGAMKSGTAIWGHLFPAGVKKAADDAWDLIQAIRKSGFDRKLGYSIEGAYLPVQNLGDPSSKACMVTNVVLTTKPVNSWAWADMAKALVAGPGSTDSNAMAGGEALRRQSLHGAPMAQIQGGKKKCGHDEETDDPKEALEHLVKCAGKPVDIAKKTVIQIFKLVA